MKRAFLSLILTVALVGMAHAQTLGSQLSNDPANFQGVFSANASINVLTTVVNRLTISADRDLDFGFVTSDPAATSTYAAPVETGLFSINGEPGATISLTPSITTATALSGGNGTVTFTPTALNPSAVLDTNTGNATIEVTGSLSISPGASGAFGETFTLEIEYTSV